MSCRLRACIAAIILLTTSMVGSAPAQAGVDGDRCRDLGRSLTELSMGSRLKLKPLARDEVAGRYQGFRDGRVWIGEAQDPASFACDSVEAVWTGHRRFWAGMYKGSVFGTALGIGFFGTVAGLSVSEDRGMILLAIPFATALSTVVGGGVGALVPHWKPRYPVAGYPVRAGAHPSRRVGSISVLGGYNADADNGRPSGSGGFQMALWMWGGGVLSIGPEFGYHNLGEMENRWDPDRPLRADHYRLTAQIQFRTKGRRFGLFSTGGTGLYFPKRRDWRMGLNAGGGASCALYHPVSLLAELRLHAMPSFDGYGKADYLAFHTVMLGTELTW